MSRLSLLVLAAAIAVAGCRTAPSAPAAPEAPGIDPSIIDASVKPCDDFYAYACGAWIRRTEIPADKPMWSRSFSDIDERNLALLRGIAEEDAGGRRDPADRHPDKVGDFWAACVDEDAIERRGLADLKAEWARIEAVQDVPGLARELGALHRAGIFPAFRITSDQDARDATQVIGVVAQGGLSLPDRDYYLKTDAKTLEIQRAYRTHVATLLRLAGVRPERATASADAVFALERSMAESFWSRVEMRDPQRTYNRVDLAGLEKATPHFPWRAYLDGLGHPGLTAFSATTPPYLAKLDQLVRATPMSTWHAYLSWRVLSSMAAERAVPRALSEERFAFQSRNFTGAKEQEARWKHCVRATGRALGEALGQAYVRRYFGADGKAATQRLVSDVEGAMGRDLRAVSWMDDATRSKALDKLQHIANKIGYPDSWRNYDALQVDRASFFRSVLAANAFEVNRDLDKIGKPLDRGEWLMPPQIVNAYYNPSMNEMVFPAGILQAPFFTRGAPDAVNYGAIGMVVGHELTHGFDDEGRKFDALGNLTDWWTPTVAQEFERRAQCVVQQYDAYLAVDDIRLNGNLTLGENLADLGGIKLALAAYQAAHARRPEAPVAGFTPEQAFFIGYAQSWCTAIRPEYARLRALTDPHSPAQWRVNGPLSDLLEFRKAFACPDGSVMAPAAARRCEVW